MRKTCLNGVYELAAKDPRVYFIGSDIAAGTLDEFRRRMPERFLMEGVYEANIVGMAAGLALDGKIPYINTIDCFLIKRALEQIELDLCFHNLKVRLIGSGGGVVYAPLGASHWALNDLALLRAIPNMTIVAPADAEEMKRLMPATLDYPGPIFIRLAKGGDPVVSSGAYPSVIGKAVPMREGGDALVVTTGILLKSALEAAADLHEQGIEAAVLHCHTVKPLDSEAILDRAKKVRCIVTAEEHSVVGGLGGAVAEIVAEAGLAGDRKFSRIGFPDVFPQGYGSQSGLMDRYGVTREGIARRVASLL
jgi:transketolase